MCQLFSDDVIEKSNLCTTKHSKHYLQNIFLIIYRKLDLILLSSNKQYDIFNEHFPRSYFRVFTFSSSAKRTI